MYYCYKKGQGINMYLIEESIVDEEINGYFVHEKINSVLVSSFFVSADLKTCSCPYFEKSHNPFNHFHILLVKYWIDHGKPKSALYAKNKKGKIVVLSPGFIIH